MITIEIENENDVTIQDSNLHLLGEQPSGDYATTEQLNAEKQARQQADQNLQDQVDANANALRNKVDKTQIATKQQAGLSFKWIDEDGWHDWIVDPNKANTVSEENEQGGISYFVTTLNLTEEENEQGGISYIVGEIEGENENE